MEGESLLLGLRLPLLSGYFAVVKVNLVAYQGDLNVSWCFLVKFFDPLLRFLKTVRVCHVINNESSYRFSIRNC